MRQIPRLQKLAMENDRYYTICCYQVHANDLCEGRIEWHHNLIIAGKQSNAIWSILPVCHKHHMKSGDRNVKERLNWIMLNRASDLQLSEVSKAIDYIALRERLNNKFKLS